MHADGCKVGLFMVFVIGVGAGLVRPRLTLAVLKI